MYDSVRQNFMAFSTQFEGRVPYMYVDVKDFVTIGVGNLIDPIGLALSLPFVFKSDPSTSASQDDITADWNAVKADPALAQKGHLACDPITKLMLTDDAINSLVLSKADQFESTLKQTGEFSTSDTWPADAQLGLLSMAWAMGPAFGSGWPTFRAACSSQDWSTAAANCHMDETANPGLSPRNAADRVLFLDAGRAASQGSDFTVLQYTLSGNRATLKAGSSGDDVTFLQSRLQALAYITEVSGTFDDVTTQAVKEFQTDNQLKADGVVGAVSWAALGTSVPSSR
jgi:GH24 family phage-related lysozyme (muramidase)